MIIDNLLRFSDGQAITATAISTNVIDFGLTSPDIGSGENLYCVVLNNVALADTATTANTVTVTLISDALPATTASPTTELTVGVFTLASSALAAGTVRIAKLPPGFPSERYVRANFTVGTAAIDSGNFDAFLVKDISQWIPKANSSKAGIDTAGAG